METTGTNIQSIDSECKYVPLWLKCLISVVSVGNRISNSSQSHGSVTSSVSAIRCNQCTQTSALQGTTTSSWLVRSAMIAVISIDPYESHWEPNEHGPQPPGMVCFRLASQLPLDMARISPELEPGFPGPRADSACSESFFTLGIYTHHAATHSLWSHHQLPCSLCSQHGVFLSLLVS
eukprot:2835469-Amphidinium_carterae.1